MQSRRKYPPGHDSGMGVLGFTLFTANLRTYANSHKLFLLNS